jgi:hypothetical protein
MRAGAVSSAELAIGGSIAPSGPAEAVQSLRIGTAFPGPQRECITHRPRASTRPNACDGLSACHRIPAPNAAPFQRPSLTLSP